MRIHPIVADAESVSPSAPKHNLPLTRRELLKGSGVLMGVLASTSPLALLAPSRAWAVELQTLDQAQGQALMAMGRVLYPHKRLPDAVYALLAKDLDKKASQNPSIAEQLRTGIAALNQGASGTFATAPADLQLRVVKSMEGQPFFATVRGQCITSLYNNDIAFAAFGYQGASWDKGGYLLRGFQDLKWLPNPPLSASPKPYLG